MRSSVFAAVLISRLLRQSLIRAAALTRAAVLTPVAAPIPVAAVRTPVGVVAATILAVVVALIPALTHAL